jgi:hypothetical protein
MTDIEKGDQTITTKTISINDDLSSQEKQRKQQQPEIVVVFENIDDDDDDNVKSCMSSTTTDITDYDILAVVTTTARTTVPTSIQLPIPLHRNDNNTTKLLSTKTRYQKCILACTTLTGIGAIISFLLFIFFPPFIIPTFIFIILVIILGILSCFTGSCCCQD